MNINMKSTGAIVIGGFTLSGKNISIQNGTVTVDGVQQDIAISSEPPMHIEIHGDVEKVETVGGDVVVNGSAGRVKTTSGDVRCGDVAEDVETLSGNITATKIGGNAKSLSGNIRVK